MNNDTMGPSRGIMLARRRLVGGGLGLLAAGAAQAQPLTRTPRQILGPYYPPRLPVDRDADLVRVVGAEARAMGDITYLQGRVRALDGTPLENALVEIWQCDNGGIYRHPNAPNLTRRDRNFQGYGRLRTGADGAYLFRTIRPVPYPGRTPHVHFQVTTTSGRELVTQLYIQGEPLNGTDSQLTKLTDPAERAALIQPIERADRLEPGALRMFFPIVMPA